MKTVVVVNPDLLFSVPRKPTLILQAREFNAMRTLFVNHLRYAPQVSDLVLAVPKVSSAGSRQGERNNPMRELIIDQLVWSLVVKPTHPGSSLRLGMGARTFLDLFQDFPALCVKW